MRFETVIRGVTFGVIASRTDSGLDDHITIGQQLDNGLTIKFLAGRNKHRGHRGEPLGREFRQIPLVGIPSNDLGIIRQDGHL